MGNLEKWILYLEGAAFLVLGLMLIYLIRRRIKIKKTEKFEKRDN